MEQYRVSMQFYMFFFFLEGKSRGAAIVQAYNVDDAKEIMEELDIYPESDRVEKYLLDKVPSTLKLDTLIPASELFEKEYLTIKKKE